MTSLLGKEVRVNDNVKGDYLEYLMNHTGVVINENKEDDTYIYTVAFTDNEEIFMRNELDVLEGGF